MPVTPFDVWRSGMSLAEAVAQTEAGRLWVKKHADVLDAYRRLQNDPRSPLFDRLESIARLQALAHDWEEQKLLLEEAREAVRQRLCAGEMRACGFIGNADQPQQLAAVPREMWQDAAHVDWESGRIGPEGNTYFDIRVVLCSQVKLDADSTPAPLGSRLA